MRILAIRGKNLASLPEFCIEFDEQPLADAGLFAICGPTGAGKSTLLDALCVALFDKTPRLSRMGGVPVGHASQGEKDRLPANDVRGILRRGSGEGFAEVDFLGCDERRYRARWEVWRARRRPYGRLQNQTMSLEDLDRGALISDTRKTDTLTLIEARLGLDFDQFRRSTLLAQGEFAAFLRADSGMRGQLLERMTGTEIYSQLSRAAFDQHKRAHAALSDLLAGVERHAVLSESDRDALESQHRSILAELESAERSIADAERTIAGHERARELQERERDARTRLDECTREWSAAQPEREAVAELARAHQHRDRLTDFDRQSADAQRAERTRADAHSRLQAADAAAEQAATRLRAAHSAVSDADARERALMPVLRRAEALDTAIAIARPALEELLSQHRSAVEAARLAAEEVNAERARIAQLQIEQHDLESALTARNWLATLDQSWAHWSRELKRYAEVAKELAKTRAQRATHADAIRRAETALARAQASQRDTLAACESARASADRARAEADELPLDAIRARRETMRERADTLRDLADIVARATAAVDRAGQHAADRVRALERERAAASNVAQRAEEIATQMLRLEEAQATLTRMQRTVALSAHRHLLVSGEPCPLCGALAHPHAHQPAPEQTLLAEQLGRVNELRALLDDLREQRGAAQAATMQQAQRAEEATELKADADAALQRARTDWHARIAELGELALVEDPGNDEAQHAVASRQRAVTNELEQSAAMQMRAAELHDLANRAHSLAASRENDLRMAERSASECRDRARAQAAELVHMERTITGCERALTDIERALVTALGPHANALAALAQGASDIVGLLRSDPLGLCAQWQAALDEFSADSERLDALHKQLFRRGAAMRAAGTGADEMHARAAALAEQVEERTCHLNGLLAERAEVLGGRVSAEVRSDIDRERIAAQRALQRATEEERAAVTSATAAAAETQAAERALTERRNALAHARVELDLALAALGFDEPPDEPPDEPTDGPTDGPPDEPTDGLTDIRPRLDALRALCAVPDAQLRQRERALAERERRLDAARTVLAERTSQRAQHAADGRIVVTRADASQAAERARADREIAYRQRGELEHRLRADDRARAQRQQMSRQIIQAEKRAHLYHTLSELIGSADGKKFRVFAQSLTLDALLSFANHHLRDLAGRYRLVRVPGYHLDLQIIDRDMGDEVRSVNSLSGGESFLVSLALALGLSSLAARDTRVESLLIDEGFGSLDPTTLDAALSVLDALQATGRQVGLISHVPGLAERVGVRVLVQPRGSGRSVVRVRDR